LVLDDRAIFALRVSEARRSDRGRAIFVLAVGPIDVRFRSRAAFQPGQFPPSPGARAKISAGADFVGSTKADSKSCLLKSGPLSGHLWLIPTGLYGDAISCRFQARGFAEPVPTSRRKP
jgi:hypothetical protein